MNNKMCPRCQRIIADHLRLCPCGFDFFPQPQPQQDPQSNILPQSPLKPQVPHWQTFIALVVAALIIGIPSFMFSRSMLSGGSNSDLQISNVRDVGGEYTSAIVGTITNTSDHAFRYVQVEINLYDNGAQVGSAMANINNLEPHGKWDFRAICLEGFTSYQVKQVTGF